MNNQDLIAQKDSRFAALRSKMSDTGTDLTVLGPGAHMQWLIGFHPHPDERPCLLLIGREREAILMPVLNAAGCREQTDITFHTWGDADGPTDALASAIAGVGAQKATQIGLDESMRTDFSFHVINALPEAHISFVSQTLARPTQNV